MAHYADWLQECSISQWQRIDMGVDLDGTGYFSAIGDGVVTGYWVGVFDGGQYLEYKLTEPGPLEGMHVYHSEGITALVARGDRVAAGQRLCRLIPGWGTGTESGWSSGDNAAHTWAAIYGGGYSENECTQAGLSFNRLTEILHGSSGSHCEGPVGGTAPNLDYSGIRKGGGSAPPPMGPPPEVHLEPGPYDWSPFVRGGGSDIAWYGGHAMDNAGFVEHLLLNARYCDTEGVR